MGTLANILIALVALEHVYFLVLEMFLWTRPAGLRAFAMTPKQAEATKVLAANQGLYNGFLALGLFWSLLHGVVCAKLFSGITLSWLGLRSSGKAATDSGLPPILLLAITVATEIPM